MSDQVFSGPIARYFPATVQFDSLRLSKNAGVIGYTNKVVTRSGADLFLNVLNGGPIVGGASVPPLQNPNTKPFWTLTNNGELGGAILLWSNVDNLISVDARIPCFLQSGIAQAGLYCKFVACITDPNNGFAVVSTHGLNQTAAMTSLVPGAPLTTAVPLTGTVNCVVSMRAGQVLTIRAYLVNPATPADNTTSIFIQDDTLGLATVQLECALSFRKL